MIGKGWVYYKISEFSKLDRREFNDEIVYENSVSKMHVN